jgi:hypothetical protein
MSDSSSLTVPPPQVERAIRLSYAQAMLNSIYLASVGGMFIIGYALRLGANNVQIGLMSTVPMLFVVVQLAASVLVERGVSRRTLTIIGSLANVSGWALVILIPYLAPGAAPALKVGALIGVIALVTLFAQVSGNARSSWIGDLIPAGFRGTFFGRLNMYAGIIGVVFALLEGTFLDHVKHMGIEAFSWLFGFGMLFGLTSVLLFVPQPDCPLARREAGGGFVASVRDTFANGALRLVMVYALLWSMQSMAGPFYATYMLRDLEMPFLGVGAVNAVATLTLLLSSPFWGRVVDRYGCRPVLIACTLALAPVPLVWIWMNSAMAVYAAVPAINLYGGFAVAGISVAMSTLIYKVTPSAGRSVQFAIYSTVVVLAVAPLPTVGGYLPRLLEVVGVHYDVRATFYFSVLFMLAAAWAARRLREPDSRQTRELMRNLPGHLRRPRSLRPED